MARGYIKSGISEKIKDSYKESIYFGEDILKNNSIITKRDFNLIKLTTPTINSIYINEISFSPNADYMATANASSSPNNLYIYKRNGNEFTKLSDPAIMPTGAANNVKFSHNGTYMAVIAYDSPYLHFYKRDGDTFTKLSNPDIIPTGRCNSIDWSKDDSHVIVGCQTAPRIILYNRSGDTFTKQTNPAYLPSLTSIDALKISNDDSFVVYGGVNSCRAYFKSGTTLTDAGLIGNYSANALNSVSISMDSSLILLSTTAYKYQATMYYNGQFLTSKAISPIQTTTTTVMDGKFSNTGNYICTGDSVGIKLFVTDKNFNLLTTPDISPSNTPEAICWSDNDDYLAIGCDGGLYIYTTGSLKAYESSKVNSFNKIGYAKENGLLSETKKCVITHEIK